MTERRYKNGVIVVNRITRGAEAQDDVAWEGTCQRVMKWANPERRISYVVAQEEVGDEGNQHWQCYLEFANGMTLSAIKRLLGIPWLNHQARNGTPKQAADYCKKESFIDARKIENGVLNEPGHRSDLDAIGLLIQEGASASWIMQSHFGTWARNHRAIAAACEARDAFLLHDAASSEPPQVLVYWGPTGTGKTVAAVNYGIEHNLNLYWVSEGTGNTWYNGIDSQYGGKRFDGVVFDEFNGHEKYQTILKICDRPHGLLLQVKGGMVALPLLKVVIFTSNVHVTEWWPRTHLKEFGKHGTHLSAFGRRITELKFFPRSNYPEVGGVILNPPTQGYQVPGIFGQITGRTNPVGIQLTEIPDESGGSLAQPCEDCKDEDFPCWKHDIEYTGSMAGVEWH